MGPGHRRLQVWKYEGAGMMRILTIVSLWGLMAGSAAAQVRMVRGGRALDRNYRLGSGGINARNVGWGPRGNLYVTGQVTGGRAFQARVPYVGSNELRLTLPSEALENFTRDSVGLDRIASGGVYGDQSFYRSSSTVLDVSTLVAGEVEAGRAGLPQPHVVLPVRPTLTAKLYGDALTPFQVSTPSGVPVNPWRIDLNMDIAAASAVAAPTQQETRPQISEVFGVLGAVESDRVATELAEGLTPGGEGGVRPIDPILVRPGTGGPTDEPPPASRTGGLEGGLIAPMADEDAFFEMLLALQQRSETPREPPSATIPPAGDEANPERLDAQPTRRSLFTGKRRSTIIEATDEKIVLHALAGKGRDLFARCMRQAKQAMSEGMFYTAAERYESAWVLRRSDPLPAVGVGLAYLAAGETYRGSEYLRLAVTRFQPLMTVRLDIGKMMGQAMAERRFREIQDRLAVPGAQAKMPLVFVMTFLHANRGDVDKARDWAGKLKALVPDDAALTEYAEYVITGATPAERKKQAADSTAPAPPSR